MSTCSKRPRTLGLLGGMGPVATVDVLDKVIRATPARRDQDHIPILIRCVPQIPDRSDALVGRGPSPAEALAQGARALRLAGADFLALACNSAHHWYESISAAFGGPVMHIAQSVTAELQKREATGPIGIMATSGTVVSGFYQRQLQESGYHCIMPFRDSQANEIDDAIACAKAGNWAAAQLGACHAADALFQRGASQVVMACTELPMALGAVPEKRWVNANLTLAIACVSTAFSTDA